MAKVKLTKTELKKQRDALKQYTRFLPTLQLKKQHLQLEMRLCLERIAENEKQEEAAKQAFASWSALFGDSMVTDKIAAVLKVKQIRTAEMNIAGVQVPVYEGVDFQIAPYDLFVEDPYLDDAVDAICKIVEIQSQREIIRRQYDCIAKELRVTTQRVNLFEKVKIPETKEIIRLINIAIGDADTSAVVRSKIAKKKLQEEPAA
ncbi:MAG: V-type ATP synthase subunit D [Lentisphaeria bacterium]|nr:V-type ATP synthase subunit D [Lentisphaeria bacterium]